MVQGFAADTDDLKRVATPQLLDDIATNALALRLGDRQFAQEIYNDVRDQAIRAPERWYDVEVSIRLSSIDERDTVGVPRFDVTIQWEYTVTPTHPVQRFACVSDRAEFRDLVSDVPSTSTWFMTPRPGFDASQRDAFELLSFSVDGEERTIRRTARKSGQTYMASIGEEFVRAGKPVRIRHLYRVITPQSGHCIFVEIAQPSRGVSLQLDYTQAKISNLIVTDLVSSRQKTLISRLPPTVSGKVVTVDLPGWVMPRAGFTFVWTLSDEAASTPSESEPTSVEPTHAAS